MPLTNPQIRAFFEDADQMGLPNATVAKLAADEGIASPNDLENFDKDTFEQVVDNLRKPGDRIRNPDRNAPAGSTIPRPPYIISAKSLKRLLETADLIRFYVMIGRGITHANIFYDPIVIDFTHQWKSLKDRKKNDVVEVPKITKTLPIIKWTEAFDDFLARTIGIRHIPLSYVTRAVSDPTVTEPLPDILDGHPHTEKYGSIEGDLVARATHDHPLFKDDNAKVYYYLEEATRGTSYAASLKTFQRSKDGRGALSSLRSQYAGKDKWEAEIKRQDEYIHNRQWNGQSNFSLEKFIALHRNAFVSMKQCAEHVEFQLPNEHSRVGFLLDAIKTSDAALNAAKAQVDTDDGPNGKRNNFEATASYLLPYDPVAKKRQAGAKRENEANVSQATAEVSSGFGSKPGIGKSGVHLRYHTKEEYTKLTNDQKLELKEWRSKNGDGKKTNTKNEGNSKTTSKKNQKKKMIASITKEVKRQLKGNDDDNIDDIIKSLNPNVSSTTEEPAAKKVRIEDSSTTKVNTSALKTILRRVKNKSDDE